MGGIFPLIPPKYRRIYDIDYLTGEGSCVELVGFLN